MITNPIRAVSSEIRILIPVKPLAPCSAHSVTFVALIFLFAFAHPTLAEDGWFSFDPKPDTFAESPIDLRSLNEKFAGEHGLIKVKDGHFIHEANGQPVRFWAVNGPPSDAKDRAALRQTARTLAKYGVTSFACIALRSTKKAKWIQPRSSAPSRRLRR